jgi:hypothetical protein
MENIMVLACREAPILVSTLLGVEEQEMIVLARKKHANHENLICKIPHGK